MGSKPSGGARKEIPGTGGIWVAVALLIVAGVATFAWVWSHWSGMDDRARFGDLLSGVAGAAAFAGMAAALVLQTLELRAQREDLRYTQDIMELQRVESEAQTKAHAATAEAMRAQVVLMQEQTAILAGREERARSALLKHEWETTPQSAVLHIWNHGPVSGHIRMLHLKDGEEAVVATTKDEFRAHFETLAEQHGSGFHAQQDNAPWDKGVSVQPGERVRLFFFKQGGRESTGELKTLVARHTLTLAVGEADHSREGRALEIPFAHLEASGPGG